MVRIVNLRRHRPEPRPLLAPPGSKSHHLPSFLTSSSLSPAEPLGRLNWLLWPARRTLGIVGALEIGSLSLLELAGVALRARSGSLGSYKIAVPTIGPEFSAEMS